MKLQEKRLEGLSTRPDGLTVISGELLSLERKLENAILCWADELGATEYRFPPVIEARHLDRIDYFQSFPHLATFPVALDRSSEILEAFSREGAVDGAVTLPGPVRTESVLTPAACYHAYVELEGARLQDPLHLTTRGTCFRREETYTTLRRQWAFSMREIVCVGTSEEVQGFLSGAGAHIADLARRLGLDVEWKSATDSFFRPERNPRFLLQRLEPVKLELVFGDLAIASTNFHHDFFGATFDIQRDGDPAFSGCAAFGIERWLHALITTHGPEPKAWPTAEVFRG